MVVELYNGIYRWLAQDEVILNYLGLAPTSSATEKARHIQKRVQPQLLAENLPLIAFYAPPGRREGKNHLVYTTDFIFDIYTQDDVELAQKIGQRLIDCFDAKIVPFQRIENFESCWETAHESTVDLENTYCFTVVIKFSISLEKNS